MTGNPRRQGGLATRMVRVTLLIGTITVLAASGVALVNTSRLSAEKAAGRDLLATQVVEDRIDRTLQGVTSMADDIGASLAESRDTVESRQDVENILRENRTRVTSAYIARIDGSVVASLSPQVEKSVRALPAFERARGGVNGFFTLSPGDTQAGQLWFTRTAIRRSGSPHLILVHVDRRFVEEALQSLERSLPERSVMILENDVVLAGQDGSSRLQLSDAKWTPSGTKAGRVLVRRDDGVLMQGHYSDIRGLSGVHWRVVVVEPRGPVVGDTLRAVAPSLAILLVGGLLGLAAAWGVAQRLVRPLRELERTARSAAAGSYVKQLAAGSDDEVGRVAGAFNLVALRLNALQDLSQLLASASQLDQVLDRILSAMGHIVGPGAAAIYLLDSDGKMLLPVRTRGIDLAGASPVDLSLGGWLAGTLATIDPSDITSNPERLCAELPGMEGVHSEALAAPLAVGLELLGVVVVLRDEPSSVTDAELEMVRTFSAQAAVAVKTSQLFRTESYSRQTAEALRSVAEELVRPAGLDKALRSVEGIIRHALSASFVTIVPVDPSVFGLGSRALRPGDDILDVATEALRRGLGDPVPILAGEFPAADRILHEFDAQELLVAPIALEGEHGAIMIAALPVAGSSREGLPLASALADEVALALENAYLYERAVTRAANLETIFRISQAVGSSLQVNVVLNRVLDVVQKILSADAVALLSFDPRKKRLTTAMARGSVPADLLHLSVGPGEDLPGHVFTTGEPVAVHDLLVGMEGVAGSAADHDLHSLLAVPLLARGRSIGVLMVFSAIAGVFNSEDLSVLQTFAAQAALALDTARLYSREHEVATVLQQSLVPDALPEFPELDADSVYAPAGADTEIGGDYYDLIRARDGSIWMSIADVCGKGVAAATKTSMIKYAVRALIAAGLTPAGVASEVNRMTTESGSVSDIVTLWIGRYDPRLRSLVWANGGHPPGLLRRADGRSERLVTTGPLMGAAAGFDYEELETPLSAGDTILLYTDGVTEARVGNSFFGEERAREFLIRNAGAGGAARGLLEEVRAFVKGEPLRDDVAVLAVRVRDTERRVKTARGRAKK